MGAAGKGLLGGCVKVFPTTPCHMIPSLGASKTVHESSLKNPVDFHFDSSAVDCLIPRAIDYSAPVCTRGVISARSDRQIIVQESAPAGTYFVHIEKLEEDAGGAEKSENKPGEKENQPAEDAVKAKT